MGFRNKVNDPDNTMGNDKPVVTGGYSCCGGRNSHRRSCPNKVVRKPSNVRDGNRKVCGFSWSTRGAGHQHICGLEPHGNRKRHVCEHPNCFDPPPHSPGAWSPGGSGGGKPAATCRRCGGSKKIPGPKRALLDCPACNGTGQAR